VSRPSSSAARTLTMMLGITLVAAACGPTPPTIVNPVPSPPDAGVASPTASAADTAPAAASPSFKASPVPDLVPSPTPRPTQPKLGFTVHVPILTYHLISPVSQAGNALRGLVVSPELFSAQLDTLKAAGWNAITVAQLAADLAGARQPPRRTFVITIDDGYDNGYTYALPILLAHGFKATFYVVAGRIGEMAGAGPILTVAHVQALLAAGMEIGNHTLNHLDLAALPPAEIQVQILGAVARLVALDGTAPATFAYPFGDRDPAVVAAVARDGFAMAVTTIPGCTESYGSRFQAPRMRVGPGASPGNVLAEVSACDG
jgi:peptidoglycan/xylan/chitin deacetylase (PgdA/CDA1 family)